MDSGEAADMSAGEKIFQANCVACHMADGGGGIGPNLTDEYWILGGGIKNVFNTISEGGRDGKGMVAWKQTLKPVEMAQVASYVLTLGGTTPANPKEPQGDIWVDPDAPAQEPTESESETKDKFIKSRDVDFSDDFCLLYWFKAYIFSFDSDSVSSLDTSSIKLISEDEV